MAGVIVQIDFPRSGGIKISLARRIEGWEGHGKDQKQILIPMFLAGAESRNEDDRDFLRSYCAWWSRSCGFKQFDDVQMYLEAIWRERDLPGTEDIWWGTVIERERTRAELPIRPEILLG
jgi:hypothetical protein